MGLVTIILVALIGVTAGTVTYDSCSMNEGSCKIELKSGGTTVMEVDLSGYTDAIYYPFSSSRVYYYTPCGTLSTDYSSCSGSKACQNEGTTYNPVGDPDITECEISGTGPTVTYGGVTASDGVSRGPIITFECVQGATLSYTVGSSSTLINNVYYYQFTVTGGAACAVEPSSGGGGGGGMSGGAVFLIIYFVLIAVYLIAGVLYKTLYKGARGLEMIPNTEFWMMVPGLIRDGCLFIYRSIASKLCNKGFDSV